MKLLLVLALAVAACEAAKLNGGRSSGRSFGRSNSGRGRSSGRSRGRQLDAGPSDSYAAPPSSGPLGDDAGYGSGPQGDAAYGAGTDLRAEASDQFGAYDDYDAGVEDPIEALGANIPGGGIPGEDYPILSSVPDTGFLCEDQEFPGYFADIADEAGCQVFHICQEDFRLDSFLCPNGTIFNQQYFVCDWWFNVDCAASEDFFGLNGDIGVAPGDEELQRDGSASNNNYDYSPPADNGFAADAPLPPSDSYGAPEAPSDSYGAPAPADEPLIDAPGGLYDTPDAGTGRSFGSTRRRSNNGGNRRNNRGNNRGRSFRG